jgi:hypothetical protein
VDRHGPFPSAGIARKTTSTAHVDPLVRAVRPRRAGERAFEDVVRVMARRLRLPRGDAPGARRPPARV